MSEKRNKAATGRKDKTGRKDETGRKDKTGRKDDSETAANGDKARTVSGSTNKTPAKPKATALKRKRLLQTSSIHCVK